MEYNIELKDIADDLVILNKNTVDTLYKLDNCADCIALYIFYYKTAKWQKTNQIKATDDYVRKSLKWSKEKTIKTKKTLKENGLIDIIQKKQNGKITGWYVKISYVISKRNIEDVKYLTINEKNPEVLFPEVLFPEGGFQDTNALKEYIKCLKKEIEILKRNKKGNETTKIAKERFETFWKEYPKKINRAKALMWFEKNSPDDETFNIMIEKLKAYKNTKQWQKDNGQFIPYATTWLNQKRWEDEIEVEEELNYYHEDGCVQFGRRRN